MSLLLATGGDGWAFWQLVAASLLSVIGSLLSVLLTMLLVRIRELGSRFQAFADAGYITRDEAAELIAASGHYAEDKKLIEHRLAQHSLGIDQLQQSLNRVQTSQRGHKATLDQMFDYLRKQGVPQ